ncbi:MAG: hypothetical protein H6767_00340 [Candidatus Peribacteria bacterium]|nr:MAG: hypothetical protein H6767_00340 [Candidatus Peribacteria bacterium]
MVNLSDEIKRKHQEYGEYFIASKISSLNENCALKTWKDYFEIAFNLLKIDGSNFQEKIENYIQKY